MARFIVTGGAGFIPSHLCDRLLADGHSVIALDNFITGQRSNIAHLASEPRFEFHEVDVSDGLPDVGKVEGIFHMASPASPADFVPRAIEILRVGSNGTFHCLSTAERHKAWFLMASTSEVYGDPEVHPQRETYFGNVNTIGVRSVYDEAKRFAEAMTMAFRRQGRVETSIVRIFNTYGPRMRKDDGRVIPNFISQALGGEPMTLYGGGGQTRSLCYVADLVDGIVRFEKKRPDLPVNLGNNREMTIRRLAEEITRLVGSTGGFRDEPLPENDPKKRCPDIGRARALLGWEPTTSLAAGLEKTIDYFRTLL